MPFDDFNFISFCPFYGVNLQVTFFLNNDSMATDIEWTDRIQKSGVYRVTVNESSRYAAAKYLPYDTDGNIGDIWIVNAIAFNSRYIGLYAIQINANRSGFGRLDTETLNMSWNN